jgi:hypothetical protein
MSGASLSVYNWLGVKVYGDKISGRLSEELNLKEAAGIYFMVINDEGKQYRRMLILQ